jgi:diacylglycerol kinase (ATP)
LTWEIVDSEWFAAILSTGFDSVVNERANVLAWPKGPQRYNVAIALELPKFHPLQYHIAVDTHSFTTEAMLIAIGNGRSYGEECMSALRHKCMMVYLMS